MDTKKKDGSGGGGDDGNFWSQRSSTSVNHSLESGYDSVMTSSNTNSSGDFFSTSSSYSTTCSGHLEPINEDYEFGLPPRQRTADLTPTTRNIARINAFHITTPVATSLLTKRSASSAFQMLDTTPLKSRRINKTPSKQQQQHQSPKPTAFRHKLDDDDDDDVFGNENNVNISQLMSPFNRSPRSSVSAEIVPLPPKSFVRHLSERSMQSSSTPINYDNLFKSKGQTVTKATNVEPVANRRIPFPGRRRILRKTNSFSPSKHFQQKFGNSCGKSLVLDLPPISGAIKNPARKLLQFNDDIFEKIIDPIKVDSMEMMDHHHDDDLLSPISRNSFDFCESRRHQLFQTPPKNRVPIEMDLDSPVSSGSAATAYQSPPFKSNNSTYTQTDLQLNADIILDTSPPASQQKNGSPTYNCSSSAAEQKRIVYGTELPRTPPKSQRKQRRFELSGAQAKRKLYAAAATTITIAKKPRKSFEGYEKMDILGRLEHTFPPLNRILNALSDADLVCVSRVSLRWRRLVESNAMASERIQFQRETMSGTKENMVVIGRSLTANQRASLSLKPFGHRLENMGSSMQEDMISSSVRTASPSTRAFLERQKVCRGCFIIFILNI